MLILETGTSLKSVTDSKMLHDESVNLNSYHVHSFVGTEARISSESDLVQFEPGTIW